MVESPSRESLKFEEDPNSDAEEFIAETEELDRQFNKFQLLDLVENNDIHSEDDEISNSEDTEAQSNLVHNDKPSNSSKAKKNNRRRKGKGGKKKKDEQPDEEQLMSQIEHYRANHSNNENLQQARDSSHLELLKVDLRHLVPENEVKRMFGKDVLREDAKSKEAKARNLLTHLGSSGGQRSRFSSNITLESKLLSSIPKMELDDLFNQQQITGTSKNNIDTKKSDQSKSNAITTDPNPKKPIYFKFVHDKAYQTAHNIFLDAAQQGFSEAIIQNLNMFPTHIESLIQLCDMMRISEDYKAASDLIERALSLFERGFHPKFNLTSGLCRMSYKRPENRSFFITLFKHIMFTNRRGLRRTPLEYSKLLLSLDPENDPLFASLLIDFYAIRSEEYDYLINFTSRWIHLSKLPNINFSLALAHFMQSKSSKRGKFACEESLKLSDKNLQMALIRYPNFIITLLDACSAEPDNELLKSQYFNYSVYTNKYKTVPESVDLLVNIYVQRNLCFWKSKDVLAWLEKNISILIRKFDDKDIIDEGQNVEYWKSFNGPAPRNLLRHVVLSELKVKVPTSASSSSVLDIDPYPPESIISYRRDNSVNNGNPSIESSSSPFGFSALFLRSMLPSFGTSDGTSASGNEAAPR